MFTMAGDRKEGGESTQTKTAQAASVKVELKSFTSKANFML